MQDYKSVPDDYVFVSWRPETISVLREAGVVVFQYGVSRHGSLHVETWAVPSWTVLISLNCDNLDDLRDLFEAGAKCKAMTDWLILGRVSPGYLVGPYGRVVKEMLAEVLSILRAAPTKEQGLRNLKVKLAAERL